MSDTGHFTQLSLLPLLRLANHDTSRVPLLQRMQVAHNLAAAVDDEAVSVQAADDFEPPNRWSKGEVKKYLPPDRTNAPTNQRTGATSTDEEVKCDLTHKAGHIRQANRDNTSGGARAGDSTMTVLMEALEH